MKFKAFKFSFAMLFSVVFTVCTSNCFGEIVSVNFGFSDTDIAGAAGAFPYTANNWNNATSGPSGSMADLIDSSVLQWKAFDAIVNSPDKRFVVNPYGPHLDVDMSSLVQSMETLYLFNEDN